MFKEMSTLKYSKSTSAYVKTEMFEYMKGLGFNYANEEQCYADRVNNRELWAKYIDDFNKDDPARLYKRCLDDQEILTGVRRDYEFKAVKALGVIDLALWIHRPGNPKDPTQTYGPELCDIMILNDTIGSLHVRVKNLIKSLGLLK